MENSRAVRLLAAGARFIATNPDPLMMRSALDRLPAYSETTVMVSDRMVDSVADLAREPSGEM